MLRRNIDPDHSGPTFEEKLFSRGKTVSIALAIAALGIAALDLVNASALTNIAAAIRDSRMNYEELPGRVLAGIRQINVYSDRTQVAVAIPQEKADPKLTAKIEQMRSVMAAPKVEVKPEQKPVAKPVMAAAPVVAPKLETKLETKLEAKPVPKVATPAVAALADVRHEDAVEFAMVQPTPASASSQMPVARPAVAFMSLPVAAAAQASLPAHEDAVPVRLASFASATASDVAAASSIPDSMPVVLPPIDKVPLPVAAPGVPPPSPAQRLNLDAKEYAKAERCLANAIYWEARSEPVRGQQAVAQVVMNRVFSPFYPKDVCSVVYQNAHRHLSCQFTFACDGKRKTITERGHWARANRIAKQTLDGQIYVPEVAKSTHYHASYVNPIWNREMKKLVKFGLHSFYRPWAWGNGDDMPAWGKPLAKSHPEKAMMARNETGKKKH